jgi:hypothetical protein
MESELFLRDAPLGVGRDLRTVLSVKPEVRTYLPEPKDPAVFPLRVHNLGSPQNPVYHARGLLPGSIDRQTRVLTPALFAPAGKWGLRQLAFDKILYCKDYGEAAVALLRECGGFDDDLLGALTPRKSLLVAYHRLVGDVGEINGGGYANISPRGVKRGASVGASGEAAAKRATFGEASGVSCGEAKATSKLGEATTQRGLVEKELASGPAIGEATSASELARGKATSTFGMVARKVGG